MRTHSIDYEDGKITVTTKPIADDTVNSYEYTFDFDEGDGRALLVNKVVRYERGDSYQTDREVTQTVRRIIKRKYGEDVTVAEPEVKDPMEA